VAAGEREGVCEEILVRVERAPENPASCWRVEKGETEALPLLLALEIAARPKEEMASRTPALVVRLLRFRRGDRVTGTVENPVAPNTSWTRTARTSTVSVVGLGELRKNEAFRRGGAKVLVEEEEEEEEVSWDSSVPGQFTGDARRPWFETSVAHCVPGVESIKPVAPAVEASPRERKEKV